MAPKASILLALAVATSLTVAQSAGCGLTPPASGVKTITVDGLERQYTLQLPDGYDPSNPYRLVVGYHWLNGNMGSVVDLDYYGLLPISEGSAIFIAPDGIDNGWANTGGRDLAFTDAFIDAALSELCVDEAQVFATGFSYGAAMTYSVACSRPDVFRAVAPIAAAQLSGCDGGTTPVPYLGIHGVADSVLPYEGGEAIRDKFLGLNGCSPEDAAAPAAGSGSHIKTEYTCNAAYPVWWIAHSGDHVPDPHDADGTYWAPGETWTFFTEAVQ